MTPFYMSEATSNMSISIYINITKILLSEKGKNGKLYMVKALNYILTFQIQNIEILNNYQKKLFEYIAIIIS